jgi:ubiquinone/menaquinone biosynthesis C-methylase UbiE
LQSQAAEYAPDSFSWRYLEKPLIDKLFSKNLKKSAKILDAGCGTGRLLSYLTKSKVQPKNIIGVDFSPEMLSIAKDSNPKVTFFRSDLSLFKSPDKFDLIICAHVLHYLNKTDYKKTLKNFYQLLKPGGRIYIVLTHPFRTVRRDLSQYFKRDWSTVHRGGRVHHCFSVQSATLLMELSNLVTPSSL